nr:MarR family transcriptional regulator [uncultured Cohaesibacter sp.]
MTDNRVDLQVGNLIFEVSRLMRRRFEEEAKGLGLTMQQARVISFLHEASSGLPQKTIAKAIDMDPMTLSGILDRLQKRKLVQRIVDPSDSRAKQVMLTEDGRALYNEARAIGEGIGQKLADRVLCRLPDSQREALITGLGVIRDELGDMSFAQKDKEK